LTNLLISVKKKTKSDGDRMQQTQIIPAMFSCKALPLFLEGQKHEPLVSKLRVLLREAENGLSGSRLRRPRSAGRPSEDPIIHQMINHMLLQLVRSGAGR
jgi:hypothetical protein